MPVLRNEIISARDYYAEHHLDTLPIMADGKRCPVNNWPNVSSDEAWLIAPEAPNIAIRCGGERHFAVIDCDDKNQPGTYDNVINNLAGLGIDQSTLPIVQTASGIGRHIYFTLSGYIPGSSRNLSPQIGSGEFRFGPGAYVVAPPSIVNHSGVYVLLQGNLSYLPEIEFSAISGILKVSTSRDRHDDSKKILKYPKLTRKQEFMLKGKGIQEYPSRSEFEFALIISLVNTGWDWNGILSLFNKFPCGGKYSELNSEDRNQAYHYLRLSYENACQWAENTSEGRQRAQDAESWAMAHTWPGRTGAYDRDAYLAHIQIAKTSGKIIYHASCRTISENSNMPRATAARATKRLVDAGYLEVIRPDIGNCAIEYRLVINETLPHTPIVRKCLISNIEHDVFCRKGLGKSSKLIWEVLSEGPKTPKELEIQTGRKLPTIRKWLKIMNELFDGKSEKPMVYESEGKWYGNQDISLERISEFLEVNGEMEKRKKRHKVERAIHNSAFMRNRRI